MRRFTTLSAALLALIAFGPAQILAKGPGSGGSGGSGGNPSSGVHGPSGVSPSGPGNFTFSQGSKTGGSMGQGTMSHKTYDANHRPDYLVGKQGHDSWRYRWDNGRWWFWGPGNAWLWYNDGRWVTYTATPYVVAHPIVPNFSGGPIKIVNPAATGVTLSYLLDGNVVSIPPGSSQDIREDHAWEIQFSRGPNLDQARYGLQSGIYTFARSDHGWELYRSEFPQAVTTPAPTAAPVNPQ